MKCQPISPDFPLLLDDGHLPRIWYVVLGMSIKHTGLLLISSHWLDKMASCRVVDALLHFDWIRMIIEERWWFRWSQEACDIIDHAGICLRHSTRRAAEYPYHSHIDESLECWGICGRCGPGIAQIKIEPNPQNASMELTMWKCCVMSVASDIIRRRYLNVLPRACCRDGLTSINGSIFFPLATWLQL